MQWILLYEEHQQFPSVPGRRGQAVRAQRLARPICVQLADHHEHLVCSLPGPSSAARAELSLQAMGEARRADQVSASDVFHQWPRPHEVPTS